MRASSFTAVARIGYSGIMREVKCPICGRRTPYEGNEFRPFCSERCKLLDFGAWVNEEYALPVEESVMTEEDIAAIERAQRDKENQ